MKFKMLSVLMMVLALSACGSSSHYTSAGSPGQDGLNSLIALTPSLACANGGVTVLTGLDSDRDGSLALTEVQASSDVCNGLDGANGADAPPTAFTPVALLDPCGDAPSVYDELLIKLQNGTVLASMNTNAGVAFAAVKPNTRFRTTDGDNCAFEINVLGAFTYQSHNN